MTKFRGRMEFSFSYPLYDTPYISLTNMDDYFIDIRRRACKSAPRVMLKQLGGSGRGMELRVWGVSGNALRRKLVVLFTVGVFYGRDAGRPVWRPASLNALHLVWGGVHLGSWGETSALGMVRCGGSLEKKLPRRKYSIRSQEYCFFKFNSFFFIIIIVPQWRHANFVTHFRKY